MKLFYRLKKIVNKESFFFDEKFGLTFFCPNNCSKLELLMIIFVF